MFAGLAGTQQIWMSHRDVVGASPTASRVVGPHRHLRASPPSPRPRAASTRVQFHPEVVHTTRGKEYLANFVFRRLRLREGLGPAPSRAAASSRRSASASATATSSSS